MRRRGGGSNDLPKMRGNDGASDFYFDGSKCTSWVCYRCGEVLDGQILINRGVSRPVDVKLAETSIGQA